MARICFNHLTKRYGPVVAVDDFTASCNREGSPASSVRTAPASRPRCGCWSG
jgi:hypothetical protein